MFYVCKFLNARSVKLVNVYIANNWQADDIQVECHFQPYLTEIQSGPT